MGGWWVVMLGGEGGWCLCWDGHCPLNQCLLPPGMHPQGVGASPPKGYQVTGGCRSPAMAAVRFRGVDPDPACPACLQPARPMRRPAAQLALLLALPVYTGVRACASPDPQWIMSR